MPSFNDSDARLPLDRAAAGGGGRLAGYGRSVAEWPRGKGSAARVERREELSWARALPVLGAVGCAGPRVGSSVRPPLADAERVEAAHGGQRGSPIPQRGQLIEGWTWRNARGQWGRAASTEWTVAEHIHRPSPSLSHHPLHHCLVAVGSPLVQPQRRCTPHHPPVAPPRTPHSSTRCTQAPASTKRSFSSRSSPSIPPPLPHHVCIHPSCRRCRHHYLFYLSSSRRLHHLCRE